MIKIILYVSLLLLVGCNKGGEKLPQLASSYQDDAILIRVDASQDLNLYDRRKHTLKLAVIQVKSVEDVQKSLLTSNGIAKLLDSDDEGAPTPQDKKIFMQTFYIIPGSCQTFRLARIAGATSVVIVAGYYDLKPAHVVRIFNIPVFESWKPISFWEVNKRMGRIGIYIRLGAQAINYTDTTAKKTTKESLNTTNQGK